MEDSDDSVASIAIQAAAVMLLFAGVFAAVGYVVGG
jgi:hypothetical protein